MIGSSTGNANFWVLPWRANSTSHRLVWHRLELASFPGTLRGIGSGEHPFAPGNEATAEDDRCTRTEVPGGPATG